MLKFVVGREMIFASYVDHIICCTTDKGLRERFMGNRVHRDARSFSRYSFPKVG